MSQNKQKNKADQYDDPNFDYTQYWVGREYENASEEIAIKRLLKNKKFKNAVDVGGGYGRLCVLLRKFSDEVTLVEPSSKQLDIAKHYLGDESDIKLSQQTADDLKFSDQSVDLLTMIRVMHHLPDPNPTLKELHRVLTDDGYLIIEVANYSHFLNRVKFMLRAKKVPEEPVDIRSRKNRGSDVIAFVNHNPKTVIKQLAHNGLRVEKILSVSNFRNPLLKRMVPMSVLLFAERLLQPILAKSFFGPSIFLLVKRAK
ncbi:MAG TPA: class I SAM-dependent methyltransferase [Candidatus Dormibacteraeota bacterium]|nr:class I SAM-dependent methyltransferase [Candidatus Dormibacteraeota bacterium]